jgi:predicted nucleotidyltransferase
VARGEASANSDIDLLVIQGKERTDPVEPFAERMARIDRWPEYLTLRGRGLYPSPEVIFMTPAELSKNPLILLDILDHGMILRDRQGFLKAKMKKLKGILKRLGAQKIHFDDGTWAWDLKSDWRPGDLIEIEL